MPEPLHDQPVFCQGWRDGRTIELQAPFWVHGPGQFTLHLTSEKAIRTVIEADGRSVYDGTVNGRAIVRLDLPAEDWYPIKLEATSTGLGLEFAG